MTSNEDIAFQERVRRLLIKHDPLFACVCPPEQHGEYDLELPRVVLALNQSSDYKVLRRELRRIFSESVGVFEAGTVFRYSRLARELLVMKKSAFRGPAWT